MAGALGVVNALFKRAVCKAYPGQPCMGKKIIKPSFGEKFGDYKYNSRPLAQLLNSSGVVASPKDVADNVLKCLPRTSKIIEKCKVAETGHIDIYLTPSFVSRLVSDILINGVRPPPVERKLRVVVDFSSPNIAKEMHVGHLRSTIIGETICRLLEFMGHDVLRLNHIGDWGTQFGMLIAHLKDKFPNYLKESPPIGDLQKFYQESKKRFDGEEDFKKRSYEDVVKLQSGDNDVVTAWKLICDVSRQEMKNVYERLGVSIIERGESFYQPLMPKIVADLEKKGLVREEDGRRLVFVPDQEVPLTIVKSDGGYTYDTSDIAALYHRIEEEKADWLIYVVDSGQGLHFQTVFGAAKMAGYWREGVRIDHVGFGVVLGEDKKKFKTRKGDSVKIKDLLDEGLERSLARLKEKGRHEVFTDEELRVIQESVAYGCVKYADLSHTRTNDYVFSFDKMLEDTGNTAVYLLYAYARLSSIIRFSGVTAEKLKEVAEIERICFTHEKELKLAKLVIRFPEILDQIANELYPHVLCSYLFKLCTAVNEFYNSCYCIESDKETGQIISINMGRIVLCEAARRVLLQAFYILGIEPLEKM